MHLLSNQTNNAHSHRKYILLHVIILCCAAAIRYDCGDARMQKTHHQFDYFAEYTQTVWIAQRQWLRQRRWIHSQLTTLAVCVCVSVCVQQMLRNREKIKLYINQQQRTGEQTKRETGAKKKTKYYLRKKKMFKIDCVAHFSLLNFFFFHSMFAVADVTLVPKAFFSVFIRFFRFFFKKRHGENEKWKIYMVQPNIRKKSVQRRERAIHWTPLASFALHNSLCDYVKIYIRPLSYIVNKREKRKKKNTHKMKNGSSVHIDAAASVRLQSVRYTNAASKAVYIYRRTASLILHIQQRQG